MIIENSYRLQTETDEEYLQRSRDRVIAKGGDTTYIDGRIKDHAEKKYQEELEQSGLSPKAFQLQQEIEENKNKKWKDLSESNQAIFLGISELAGAPQIKIKYRKYNAWGSDWDDVPTKYVPSRVKTTRTIYEDGYYTEKSEFLYER